MAKRQPPKPKQADVSELEPLSISRIGSRASCGAAWELRYRDRVKPEFTAPHFFVGTMVHEALESYYKGEFDSLNRAIRTILPRKLKEMGLTPLQVKYVKQVSDIESDIMGRFERGEITKPNGERYTNPRMTGAYKELAKTLGLFSARAGLENVTVGNVQLPAEGIPGIVSRILSLCDRYEASILIPREYFEELHVEEGFDFVDTASDGTQVRLLGYMDLVGKIKPEYRDKFGGKTWVLIDFKTSKSKEEEEHFEAANTSMQLSLYQHVVVSQAPFQVNPDDLYIALHYLDSELAAPTRRSEADYRLVVEQGALYYKAAAAPVIAKRLHYDGDDCKRCEYRQACIKKHGKGTVTPFEVGE